MERPCGMPLLNLFGKVSDITITGYMHSCQKNSNKQNIIYCLDNINIVYPSPRHEFKLHSLENDYYHCVLFSLCVHLCIPLHI